MLSTRKKKLGVNLALVLALAAPALFLALLAEPYDRGFYCDDQTIRHPYLDNTVSSFVAYIVGMLGPILAIVCAEIYVAERARAKVGDGKFNLGDAFRNAPYSNMFDLFLGFLLAAAINQTLNDMTKYVVGRLRPHFLDVCNPDYEQIECFTTDGHGNSLPVFVTDFKCRGNQELFPDSDEREHKIKDGKLSFPSGHASYTAMAMVYIILYLQARLASGKRPMGTYLVPLVQTAAAVFAIYTSISRVSDYAHNPGDVLGGAILGTAVQVMNVFFIQKLFIKFRDERRRGSDSEPVLVGVQTAGSQNGSKWIRPRSLPAPAAEAGLEVEVAAASPAASPTPLNPDRWRRSSQNSLRMETE